MTGESIHGRWMAFGLQTNAFRFIFSSRLLYQGKLAWDAYPVLDVICTSILTSVLDFQVGIAGVPADTTMNETKRIEDNWTPVWNQEFTFPLTVPELALLRVEVHEYDMSEKDDFAGQTCLPVSELKPGIRAVPLFDRKGEKMASVRLLMRFEFV